MKNPNSLKEGGPDILPVKRNRLLCILLLLALMLTQVSCWDRVEVEDLGIVLATSLDLGDEEEYIRVYIQVINPQALAGSGNGNSGGTGPATYRNFTHQGYTIFDAVRGLARHSPRELYFAHNQIIIISEQLARRGVGDLIDFFDRNPQIRRNNWLLITPADTCQIELFDIPQTLEPVPAMRIMSIIEDRHRAPVFAASQLGDFLELISSPGIEGYTAGVTIIDNPMFPESGEEAGKSRFDILLGNTAVFKGGRMVGWLNDRESRGLLWVREGLQGGIVAIPDKIGGDEKTISMEIIGSKTKTTPVFTEEGDVTMHISVKTEANLNETEAYIDLGSPEKINQIARVLEEEIQKDILLAVARAQQYNADIFGFGQILHRQHLNYWRQAKEDWDNIFSNLEVTVSVEAEIPRTGLISRPIKPLS